ncbi:unnamed protein product [Sphagnum balticum]
MLGKLRFGKEDVRFRRPTEVTTPISDDDTKWIRASALEQLTFTNARAADLFRNAVGEKQRKFAVFRFD